MNRPMKYHAVLLKDGGPTTYENTSVIAVDNSEALKKVKKWMASFECVADDAWLQITLNGVGIRSLQPGGVLTARPRKAKEFILRPALGAYIGWEGKDTVSVGIRGNGVEF